MNVFKGLLAAVAALAIATPAIAWVDHYYPDYSPPTLVDNIRSKRDGLRHPNARLVAAHKDRLNRVLVAMGETTDVGHVVEIHTQGQWQRATSWSSCSEAPAGWQCRHAAPSAMSMAEVTMYKDRFNNHLWRQIYDTLGSAILDEYSLHSWGSWDALPPAAKTIVDNETALNVQRYNLGAPDMKTPAEMNLAGATFKGHVDGTLNPAAKERIWNYWEKRTQGNLTGHGDTTLHMTISDPHALSASITIDHELNYKKVWKSGNKTHTQTGRHTITLDKWTVVDVDNPEGFRAASTWKLLSTDGTEVMSQPGGVISGSFYGNGTVAAGDVKTGNVIGTWKAWNVTQ